MQTISEAIPIESTSWLEILMMWKYFVCVNRLIEASDRTCEKAASLIECFWKVHASRNALSEFRNNDAILSNCPIEESISFIDMSIRRTYSHRWKRSVDLIISSYYQIHCQPFGVNELQTSRTLVTSRYATINLLFQSAAWVGDLRERDH